MQQRGRQREEHERRRRWRVSICDQLFSFWMCVMCVTALLSFSDKLAERKKWRWLLCRERSDRPQCCFTAEAQGVSRPCPLTRAWTLSRVCLSHMKNAAGDSPVGRVHSAARVMCCCLQHRDTGVHPYHQRLFWHLRWCLLPARHSFSSWDICIHFLFFPGSHLLCVGNVTTRIWSFYAFNPSG